jgi:hypothetical protein
MAEQHNRRKNHLFGMTFDISVKWLVLIVFGGLVQFGVFLNQFHGLSESVEQMRVDMRVGSVTVQTLTIKDATQDADIAEIKRRLNGHDRRARGN